jgi:hypothetical protein
MGSSACNVIEGKVPGVTLGATAAHFEIDVAGGP